MKLRLSVKKFTPEIGAFIQRLLPELKKHGAELVVGDADIELDLGKGSDTEKRIHWTEYTAEGAAELIRKLFGKTAERVWSLYKLSDAEAEELLSTFVSSPIVSAPRSDDPVVAADEAPVDGEAADEAVSDASDDAEDDGSADEATTGSDASEPEPTAEEETPDLPDEPTMELGPTLYATLGRTDGELRLYAVAAPYADEKGFESDCERLALLFAPYLYAEESIGKAAYIVRVMTAAGKKLSVAESYTGGGLAARLTAVPGASAVLNEGIVAYTESAKVARLRVDPRTITLDTAVSIKCVYEMAVGLLNGSAADLVVATTGYAGPAGESVGKCFLAVGDASRIDLYEQSFSGDRAAITQQGVEAALDKLIDAIRKFL